MLAILVGLIFVGLGCWGILKWYVNLIYVLKGLVPIMIIVGGSLAVIAGITSIRDSVETRSEAKKKKS